MSATAGTVTLAGLAGLICQTFFFGIYATFAIFLIYATIKTGLKNGIQRYFLIMSFFMFVVSTFFWFVKVVGNLSNTRDLIDNGPKLPSKSPTTDPRVHIDLILSAFVLINYGLADAVVLWRAWVLCSSDYRKQLYIPLFFLCCATVTISGTIVTRIAMQSIPHVDGDTSDPRIKSLTRVIDIFQVANMAFSLLLNLSATGLVVLKAWQFRQWIKFDLKAIHNYRTRGEKIMILLIESGAMYCISVIIALASMLIRLPVGVLGPLYIPLGVQIAGLYSLGVLLLVNYGWSLEQMMLGRNIATNISLDNPGTLESKGQNT